MYTFVPLPSIEQDPITRPKPMQQWDTHSYPYDTLPDLECHIAPPFAVINGGPKCMASEALIKQISRLLGPGLSKGNIHCSFGIA
jgi:hypothetical protein